MASRKSRGAVMSGWAGVAALALVISGCATDAKGNASASGKSYCAGHTVTFLAPDDPGGNSDLQMRIIAPAAAKILGCTVHVTDAPQGNTVVGQDLVAKAKPDGLTVGYLQVSKDLYNEGAGKKSINFDPESVQFLASTNGTPNVIIASPSSGITSFQDVIHAAKPVKILSSGGSGAMTITLLLAAYGVKANLVNGYSSSAALVQGFLRGDGPVTNSALSALSSVITSGKAKAILMDTEPPAGELADQLKGVPVYADLVKQEAPTTADGQKLLEKLTEYRAAPSDWYFVPKGTPADALKQLRDAFKGALTDPAVQKKLAALGVDGYVPGEQGLKYVKEMEGIVPYMKKYAS